MGIVITILTVFFFLLCLLLVILILLQSDKSAGMGILGGSSQSAFGSSTADVITKTTGVMIALFMVISLSLSALESIRANALKKSLKESKGAPQGQVVEEQSQQAEPEQGKPGNTQK